MMFNFTLILEANPAGSPWMSMILMFLMLGAFWFLLMRPQRKREKQLREDLKAMKVGDKIMTIGGIVGMVTNLNNDEVTITTSSANTLMTFKISAISQVFKPASEQPQQPSTPEKQG